jgi:predicted phosphoribosyltransferase
MLEVYRGRDALVLAIPAGGVPVAVEIARGLGLPLDVAAISKITPPWNPESGYGAVAFDGTVILNERTRAYFRLTDQQVAEGVAQTREKVDRRMRLLRGEHPLPQLAGRVAILVDDGLASGITMQAAIQAMRGAGAGEIVVAVPTGSRRTVEEIAALASATYCPNIRGEESFAVSDAYQQWRDISEDEAKTILDGFARRPA